MLEREPDVASVASKVLDWDGDNIDYVDGSLTWYGMGYKWECERPDTGEYDTAQDVLFATGSAMFVRAEDYAAPSAGSTTGTSCSTRTSTSAGGSTCWAGGCATCPVRSPTTATTPR